MHFSHIALHCHFSVCDDLGDVLKESRDKWGLAGRLHDLGHQIDA